VAGLRTRTVAREEAQWEDKIARTGWERIDPVASSSLKDLKP